MNMFTESRKELILGAGATGLAAGYATGLPVYEASKFPGGICSSYYVRPGQIDRHHIRSRDEEDFRFEIGGGHWIFGGEAESLAFIESFTPTKEYTRVASVFLADLGLVIPYPIQSHLSYLPEELAKTAASELASAGNAAGATLKEWLAAKFGKTLCRLFFDPFHQLYTAGLWHDIAPQDSFKSPSTLQQGSFASRTSNSVGYNATFKYPEAGLGSLFLSIAEHCSVLYGKKATRIETCRREVFFNDGSSQRYETLLSTLPLNVTCHLAGIQTDSRPDPFTSVLVLNIGGRKGDRCPADHWIYFPASTAGFHRVGFYSNVDESFLPRSARGTNMAVSLYVEKAYVGGRRPSDQEIARFVNDVVLELQSLGYLQETYVVDPTWIEVAYTWHYPNSPWREEALSRLHDHGIHQLGRYGRWRFQGIAESIGEGLRVRTLRTVE
jgi:protoporphyrinogen oxidase